MRFLRAINDARARQERQARNAIGNRADEPSVRVALTQALGDINISSALDTLRDRLVDEVVPKATGDAKERAIKLVLDEYTETLNAKVRDEAGDALLGLAETWDEERETGAGEEWLLDLICEVAEAARGASDADLAGLRQDLLLHLFDGRTV